MANSQQNATSRWQLFRGAETSVQTSEQSNVVRIFVSSTFLGTYVLTFLGVHLCVSLVFVQITQTLVEHTAYPALQNPTIEKTCCNHLKFIKNVDGTGMCDEKCSFCPKKRSRNSEFGSLKFALNQLWGTNYLLANKQKTTSGGLKQDFKNPWCLKRSNLLRIARSL